MSHTRPIAAVLSLGLVAFAVGGCGASKPGVAPEARPAPVPLPSVLAPFTAAHEQLFLVNDPLPWLRRALNSPGLRRALVEGERAAGHFDPDAILAALRENERWVPAEVAIGMEPSVTGAFDAVIRLSVLMPIGQAVLSIGDDEAKRVIAEIESETLAVVERTRVPALRVHARMRAPADAAALVEQVRTHLEQQGGPPDVKLTLGPRRVALSLRVGDLVPEPMIRAMLANLGLVTDFASPAAARVAAAVSAWQVDITLEVAGADGVLLTIGPPPSGPPLTSADLGPSLRWEAADIAWARWNVAALQASFAAAEALRLR